MKAETSCPAWAAKRTVGGWGKAAADGRRAASATHDEGPRACRRPSPSLPAELPFDARLEQFRNRALEAGLLPDTLDRDLAESCQLNLAGMK